MLVPLASWTVNVAVHAMYFIRHPGSGIILAVATTNGEVHLYHPKTGRRVTRDRDRTVVEPEVPRAAPVHALTYLPDPSRWPDLVAVGGDATIRVYDLLTGQLRAALTLPVAEALTTATTIPAADGAAMIAVAGGGDAVYLWRGDGAPQELLGHTGPVRLLKSLPERQLAAADARGITVWDLSGTVAQVRSFCPGRSRSAAVLREQGQVRLVSAAADGIRLIDPGTGEQLRHFARTENVASVVTIDVAPGKQLLAVASGQTVTLWSPATEELSESQLDHVPPGTLKVLTRILTGNGTLLAAGDEQGNVTVWRLMPPRRAANQVGSHEDWINDLAVVRPAGHRVLLASASDDRTLRLWSVEDVRPYGDPVRFTPETQVHAVAAVDGDLAVGDQLGFIRRLPVGRSVPLWVSRTHHPPARTMASFRSPDGWRIVSAGGSGHCDIWEARSGRILHELRPPSSTDPAGQPPPAVRAVAAAELAGRWYVAAGDMGGRIEVWDAETGELYWTLPHAHGREQVRSLAFLDTGGRVLLASGSSAGTIRLWDLAERRPVASTTGHGGPVSALCPVQDGEALLLASGGADGGIRLWDPLAIGRPVSEVLNAHSRWVRALTQVRGGRAIEGTPLAGSLSADEPTELASAGEDGEIWLWGVEDGRLVAGAYGRVVAGAVVSRPQALERSNVVHGAEQTRSSELRGRLRSGSRAGRLFFAGALPVAAAAAVAIAAVLVLGFPARPVSPGKLVGFVVLSGVTAMAVIEIAKRLLPLRSAFQRRQVMLWLLERSPSPQFAEVAMGQLIRAMELGRCRDPHLGPRRQGTAQASQRDEVSNGSRVPNRWLDIFTATRGVGGPFNLPAEQLTAQIGVGIERATQQPMAYEELMSALRATTSTDRGGPPRRALDNGELDVLSRDQQLAAEDTTYELSVAIDQLQIRIAGRWRHYLQVTAWWLTGVLALTLAEMDLLQETRSATYVLAAVAIGGFFAWLSRDVVAVVERLGR